MAGKPIGAVVVSDVENKEALVIFAKWTVKAKLMFLAGVFR